MIANRLTNDRWRLTDRQNSAKKNFLKIEGNLASRNKLEELNLTTFVTKLQGDHCSTDPNGLIFFPSSGDGSMTTRFMVASEAAAAIFLAMSAKAS